MKKSTNRAPLARLQSLDVVQLARVSGGVQHTDEYFDVLFDYMDAQGDWPPGSGWNEFFFGAFVGATTPL